MALKNAKIITVTSVKGGTGKTNLVLNLALELEKREKKTMIIDLDLYTGAIAPLLKAPNQPNIFNFAADLMANSYEQIEDYVKKYSDYIDILPAPEDPRSVGKIDVKYVDLLIKKIIYMYDVILIDTNHAVDPVKLVSMDLSDRIVYVMTNDIIDITNMKTMVSIYKDMNINNFIIVLNEALSRDTYNKYDIRNIIGTDINYVIPKKFYNRNINKSILEGSIPVLDKNGQVLAALVDELLS